MKEKLKKNNKIVFVLVCILVISAFFRFFHISTWLFWGMDQEYEAFLVKNIMTGKHFPLIGVNAADTGLYLGPIFIYLASIPFLLFSGNPLGWAISASVIGVFVTYLVYRVGKVMFSETAGLFGSLIYASSFLISFYDRQFWNPMPIPFFSLIIGFFLYKIINNNQKVLLWLFLSLGVAVQCHLSILIFLPLIIFVIWKKYKIFSKKILLFSLGIFLITQLPVITFELKHNFINTKSAITLIKNPSANTNILSTWKDRNEIFISTLGRIFFVPSPADLFVESGQCKELLAYKRNAYPEEFFFIAFAILVFIFWYISSRKNVKSKSIQKNRSSIIIVGGIFVSTIFFVELYGRSFFEYYFLFLFPWLAIVLGKSFEFLWQKKHGYIIVIPVISFFILLNFISMLNASYSYSYANKLAAINFAKNNLAGKRYSLEALGECPRFGGYRYLFEYYFKKPHSSYMDSYFAWLYGNKSENDFSIYKEGKNIVLLSLIDSRMDQESISKWEKIKLPYLIDYNIIKEQRFGRIEVFILASKRSK
ncbi:glycosyltransferase family 39 protein [Candidatus Gottesmanbacteria bacterium]|nr:glycosyltransferase family 39 protein [Candidatus Gottesmanbacteria bacterium]